jgi:peptide/nickel transport system substrate-binding protein
MKKFILLVFIGSVLLSGLIFSSCSTDDIRSTEEPGSPPSDGSPETTPSSTELEPGVTAQVLPGTETPGPAQPAEPVVFWTNEKKQAVAAAIDRELIVDRVFEGYAASAYYTIPPGYNISTDPFFQMYGTRDLELSIALLNAEGYTEENPLVIDLWTSPQPPAANEVSILDVIKEQLEDTGLILVNLHQWEGEEYLPLIDSGEIPLFLDKWFPDFSDPANWLSSFASCALSPDLGIHYCSPVMDQMLHLVSAAIGDQRTSLYEEIGEMLAADPPVVPLFWEQTPLIYRTGIQAADFGPNMEFNFSGLQFDEDALPASGSLETMVIGTTDRIENQDRFRSSSLLARDIFNNTGLPLMRFLPGTTELVPGAAADYPNLNHDEMTYTFQLREGLAFSDGTPVSSQDYLRTWERHSALENDRADLVRRYIEEVSAPDEQTLVYHLRGANSFFPALAATTMFLPLHPNHPGEVLNDLANTATGPYRLVSHYPGEETVLEINPEYGGDENPTVRTVILRYFEDSAALARAVETGEIDLAWQKIDLEEAFRLQNNKGLTVEMINLPKLHFLAFNHLYFYNEFDLDK